MKKGIFWSLVIFLAAAVGAAAALAFYFHKRMRYLEDDLEFEDNFYDEFEDDEEFDYDYDISGEENARTAEPENLENPENWADLSEESEKPENPQ